MRRNVGPTAALAVALILSLALSLFLVLAGGSSSSAGAMTVPNSRFEDGSTGWAPGRASTQLAVTEAGRYRSSALRVTTRRRGWTGADSTRPITDGSPVGTSYAWSAWMRTNRTGLRGRLVVRELVGGSAVQTRRTTVGLVRGSWVRLRVPITRLHPDSRFTVRVASPRQRTTDVLRVDDVKARRKPRAVPTATTTTAAAAAPTATPSTTPSATATATSTATSTASTTTPTATPTASTTPAPATGPTLSNGCGTTRRGIPLCGAFLGSAYGANSDPAPMEADMDARLGVRRTYFTGSQVSSGVSTAARDLAAGRLPWISFKLPYSWAQMEAGAGDAWARDLATRLAALPGPVWVAFHHEPEGDGDIQTWRRMQERLAPIVRGVAPNVAYTVVLTGWHQLYGDAQFSLDAIWPRVKVDLAGFDVYNQYGVVKNGTTNTKGTNLRTAYFEPISRWAAAKGVAWGIAETGFTDAAAELYPHWVRDTHAALDQLDGVAFTYFNTTLNSIANWALTTTAKRESYREAAVGSPVLPLR